MISTVLISAVVGLLLMVFLGGREAEIRAWLASRAEGFARRVYVRLFVDAVRGRGRSFPTVLLMALVGGSLLLGVAVLTGGTVYLETQAATVRGLLSGTERVQRVLTEPVERVPQEPRDTVALLAAAEAAQQDAEELLADLDRMSRWHQAAANGLLGLYFLCCGLWFPFAFMRSRLATEVERFSTRLRMMASEEELAHIALAEAKVADEETLSRYLAVLRTVAERRKVPELIRPFDMWHQEPAPVEGGHGA